MVACLVVAISVIGNLVEKSCAVKSFKLRNIGIDQHLVGLTGLICIISNNPGVGNVKLKGLNDYGILCRV